MKKRIAKLALVPLMLALLPAAAFADPWKDESGHGRYYERDYGRHDGRDRGEYKEEYWDGACKVERKYKRNGDYKEERKCRAPQPAYVVPQPVYPAPMVQPGVVVHGTVTLP